MRALTITLGTTAAAAALLVSQQASADQLIIRNPGDHADFRAELEPHGTFVPWGDSFGYAYGRYGRYVGNTLGFGAGFRATIKVADPVIPRLNNTIGVTFGIDFTNCDYCYYREHFSFWTPVGAQWTFFLTKKWSVFADIGIIPFSDGFYRNVWVDPMFEVGGRFHFRDKITLTMRLGYPFITVGVSFFI